MGWNSYVFWEYLVGLIIGGHLDLFIISILYCWAGNVSEVWDLKIFFFRF